LQSRPGGHGDPGDVPVFWSEVRNYRTVEAEFVEDRQMGLVRDRRHSAVSRG
jgi:hypothetical protein